MSVHPYDNKERRFRHSDPDRAEGLAWVASLLHLPRPLGPEGVLYDLSFFSGGIGIIDQLAITLPIDAAGETSILEALDARTLEDAVADPAWGEELLWLLSEGDEPAPPDFRGAAARFIDRHRKTFQPASPSAENIHFVAASGVNSWTVLWRNGELLSYRSFDQG